MTACLEITTVSHCKNVCEYCPQQLLLSRYKKKEFLTLDTFVKCLSKVPKSTLITMAGFVEPFLNPLCGKFIAHANAEGYTIALYTTLVGLTKEMVDEIQHVRFSNVQLHLPDAWDLMKANVNDEYVEVAKYFISKVRVNGSHVYGPLHEKLEGIFGHVERRQLDKDLHTRANNVPQEKIAIKHHAHLTGEIECDVVLRRNNGVKTLDFNILLPNGDVQICCQDYGLTQKFGNLLTDSYESLFESETYKYVQRALKDDTLSLLCRTCKEARQV